jgi:hypothetical protein
LCWRKTHARFSASSSRDQSFEMICVWDLLLVDLQCWYWILLFAFINIFLLRLKVGYTSFGTVELCRSLSAVILSVFDHCVHCVWRRILMDLSAASQAMFKWRKSQRPTPTTSENVCSRVMMTL